MKNSISLFFKKYYLLVAVAILLIVIITLAISLTTCKSSEIRVVDKIYIEDYVYYTYYLEFTAKESIILTSIDNSNCISARFLDEQSRYLKGDKIRICVNANSNSNASIKVNYYSIKDNKSKYINYIIK